MICCLIMNQLLVIKRKFLISCKMLVFVSDDLKQMVVKFACPPDLTTAIIIALNKVSQLSVSL